MICALFEHCLIQLEHSLRHTVDIFHFQEVIIPLYNIQSLNASHTFDTIVMGVVQG